MPAYYSVVQYSPDVVRGERINIGVVAFSAGKVRWRFLRDWRRVRHFGSPDVEHLKQIASEFESLTDTQVHELVGRPRGLDTIQFTEPAGSLLEVDEILRQSASRFLVEHEPGDNRRTNRPLGHSAAVKLAKSSMVAALTSEVGNWSRKLVKSKVTITGGVEPHEFDLAIGNGTPIVAAQVLAFHAQTVQKDIDATAWLLTDVQAQSKSNLRIAVFSTPAGDRPEAAERAKRVFGELRAEVVPVESVGEWTKAIIPTIGLLHGVAEGPPQRAR